MHSLAVSHRYLRWATAAIQYSCFSGGAVLTGGKRLRVDTSSR
jgi:hypothetical protein